MYCYYRVFLKHSVRFYPSRRNLFRFLNEELCFCYFNGILLCQSCVFLLKMSGGPKYMFFCKTYRSETLFAGLFYLMNRWREQNYPCGRTQSETWNSARKWRDNCKRYRHCSKSPRGFLVSALFTQKIIFVLLFLTVKSIYCQSNGRQALLDIVSLFSFLSFRKIKLSWYAI